MVRHGAENVRKKEVAGLKMERNVMETEGGKEQRQGNWFLSGLSPGHRGSVV